MKKALFILLLAGLLAGCETLPFELPSARNRAAAGEDQLIAQENMHRLHGRIEALEMEINRLNRDLDTLRSQIDTRCAAIERKSEADKREIAERLSAELNRLMKQASAPPPPAPKGASGGGAYGIEHTVRSGETLYLIAKAYNVSAKTIMDANKMQDAGKLLIGQKLFIPQP